MDNGRSFVYDDMFPPAVAVYIYITYFLMYVYVGIWGGGEEGVVVNRFDGNKKKYFMGGIKPSWRLLIRNLIVLERNNLKLGLGTANQ